MSSNQKLQHSFFDPSSKPKKLIRSNKTPVYADEVTEIKINSHVTRLTFGVISPDADNLDTTHTLVNESVTVALPTANFLAAVSQMIIPLIENEQLLQVLSEDYSNISEYAKTQLEQLKSAKK
ncbi:hypothetical protein [Acinetobacter sp.]|uniref:hypothetical protein n=1 Tax=Acinetobacter sp. TaxID=472 RepID=UPI0028A077F1|nr:hypothetical protein [Acinetobacter sp.]